MNQVDAYKTPVIIYSPLLHIWTAALGNVDMSQENIQIICSLMEWRWSEEYRYIHVGRGRFNVKEQNG